MIHVVDTHALIRHLESSAALGRIGRAILVDPGSSLVVPVIVLAEARYMSVSRKADLSWDQVLQAVLGDDRFTVYDVTLEVLDRIDTRLEMHDAIICAIAMLLRDSLGEEVAVITRDKDIRASGLVQTVW